VTLHSNSYRVLQPPAFTNQYAAVPSLHFGWNMITGMALVHGARRLLVRIFGLLLPVAMGAAVVLTANHFILDVVAGAAVALLALWLARRLQQRSHRSPARPIALPATGSKAA
jgi:membrane-associated phospholipid phosphatase